MNIPNILTTIRFFIVPVFAYFLIVRSYAVATLLFLVAGMTDILDGYMARKFNMTTKWGKLADPLADKITQVTALAILTYQDKIPIIIVIVVAIKELLMVVGGILLYKDRVVVAAGWYGKLATVVFYLAIVMIIFDTPFSDIFVMIAVAATLFAFIRYAISYKRIKAEVRHS